MQRNPQAQEAAAAAAASRAVQSLDRLRATARVSVPEEPPADDPGAVTVAVEAARLLPKIQRRFPRDATGAQARVRSAV